MPENGVSPPSSSFDVVVSAPHTVADVQNIGKRPAAGCLPEAQVAGASRTLFESRSSGSGRAAQNSWVKYHKIGGCWLYYYWDSLPHSTPYGALWTKPRIAYLGNPGW